MTIKEAMQQRIPRVRQSQWQPNAYLRLPLLKGGMVGVWMELYDDVTQQAIQIRPGSQRITTFADDSDNFEPFTGTPSPFEKDPNSLASGYEEQ